VAGHADLAAAGFQQGSLIEVGPIVDRDLAGNRILPGVGDLTRDGTTAFSSQKYACAGGGMALALFAQLRLRWSVLQVIGAAAALGVARQLQLLG